MTTTTNRPLQHKAAPQQPSPLTIPRRFSQAGISPFDAVRWRLVKVKAKGVGGEYEGENVNQERARIEYKARAAGDDE